MEPKTFRVIFHRTAEEQKNRGKVAGKIFLERQPPNLDNYGQIKHLCSTYLYYTINPYLSISLPPISS